MHPVGKAPTKVIFREHDGETVAFFPEVPASPNPHECGIYVHVGQHGAASQAFYYQTRPTLDYDDLLDEMEGRGYILQVRRRWTRAMDRVRDAGRVRIT